MRSGLIIVLVLNTGLLLNTVTLGAAPAADDGFESIFDGQSLASAKTSSRITRIVT